MDLLILKERIIIYGVVLFGIFLIKMLHLPVDGEYLYALKFCCSYTQVPKAASKHIFSYKQTYIIHEKLWVVPV